jgi:hypothetical protein
VRGRQILDEEVRDDAVRQAEPGAAAAPRPVLIRE